MSDPLEILVVRRFYEELWNAWRLELAEEILATEDRAATRMTWQGTHRGRLCDIEPTGAHIEYCGAAFFRLPGGVDRGVSLARDTARFPGFDDGLPSVGLSI